jgi:hypothetical protein
MKNRFSADALRALRNEIPIDRLIEAELSIPAKRSQGVFRFLCPVCNEFQTAVKPATNLARCFRCEMNFNTIEITMRVKKIGFLDSAAYLTDLLHTNKKISQLVSGIGRPLK